MTTMNRPLPPDDLRHVLECVGSGWNALRNARVLFTGASGFFGSWMLESFLYAGTQLDLPLRAVAVTRDAARFSKGLPHLAGDPRVEILESDAATLPVPEGAVDFVIHSLVPDAGTPLGDQEVFFRSATARLLGIASKKRAGGFLLCSTGAVYQPHDPPAPFAEGDPLVPLDAELSYGQIRRKVEDQCLKAWKDRNVPVKIARGFAFIGPRLPLDGQFAAGNFIGDALAGSPITVKGDGTAVRSYLYAADMAAWLWTILFKGEPGRAFNVGSEVAICIADLAQAVSQSFASPPDVHMAAMPDHRHQKHRYVPSCDRARKLGLEQRVLLREQIQKTTTWTQLAATTQLGRLDSAD